MTEKNNTEKNNTEKNTAENNNDSSRQFTLETVLLQSLEEGGMIVCIKDLDKIVLKQNKSCIKLCGDREGQICCDGCMEIYAQDDSQQWDRWGNRTYRNSYLHDNYYDVTLLCSDHHLVSILQPLEEKQAIAIEHYRKLGLSKRELEVITEAVAGLSNTQISEKLSISNATIRTHLNNIYAKVLDAGGSLSHIPKQRSNAGG